MVNKYRVKKMIDFIVPTDEFFIYDPIGDIYRKGNIAVNKKFIEIWKGYFEEVPEIQVSVVDQSQSASTPVFTAVIKIPPGTVYSETRLQEIIYNALDSQK